MECFANTPFRNEAWLFLETLPIWERYPINRFIFCDDHSIDDSRQVILDILGDRAVILDYDRDDWHESRVRSLCWEYAREAGADVIVSIDADELLSPALVNDWDRAMEMAQHNVLLSPQINIVEETFTLQRTDPAYANNIREFIHPVATSRQFIEASKYHSSRTPQNSAGRVCQTDWAFIHLQAANVEFYALKQLWYKLYELVQYGFDPGTINSRYDSVVNNLVFYPMPVEEKHYSGLKFNFGIFAERIKSDPRFQELIYWYDNYRGEYPIDDIVTFGRDIFDHFRVCCVGEHDK